MITIDATPLQTLQQHHGTGTYTSALLRELISLSSDSFNVLLYPPKQTDLPIVADLIDHSNICSLTIPRISVPYRNVQWLVNRFESSIRPRFISSALRNSNTRLYHAIDPSGTVSVPRIPMVVTLFDLIPLHYPQLIVPLRQPDIRAGYARYLAHVKRAHHIIAISEATKRDAVERLRIPPDRISVTPLAADGSRFYPRQGNEIKKTLLSYKVQAPYLLHVGASLFHKNTLVVIQAFNLLCQEDKSDHVLCVTGAYEPQTYAYLERHFSHLFKSNRLYMLGVVAKEDLPCLYSGADALVYPSLVEGFGLPVLEAMCCGTAVLTSNTSSLPEVGGDAALYVNPHDIQDIAAGMHRLITQSDLRSCLVQRGFQRAQMFSWRKTAQKTLQIYQELTTKYLSLAQTNGDVRGSEQDAQGRD